jgi:Cdc6-like AAA superfamily ATPase
MATSSAIKKNRRSQDFDKTKVQQVFVTPPSFRPNTVFVGRQKELEDLHSRLFQSEAQGYDNKSVLITGIAGSGKTQLALEYVFTHRESYPGGIFWIRASSYESACEGFKEIAQAAGLPENTEAENAEGSGDQGSQCVSDVLEWLAMREDWLLVFDGMELEDEDATTKFRRLIPRNPKGILLVDQSTAG